MRAGDSAGAAAVPPDASPSPESAAAAHPDGQAAALGPAPESGAEQAIAPPIAAVDRPGDLPPSPPAGTDGSGPRQLHPLPRGLVELYGLLAVLVVLVPEWMAGGALLGFRETREGSLLPPQSTAWRRLPELRLAGLNLAQLRQLACRCGLRGYGRDNRERLTARLLRQLRRRPI